MNFVTPNSFGMPLREANDCHTPAGSPEGGQFCSKTGSGRGARGAATHNGECQLCGAQQALPRGVLSKHGYNVRWGFFSGTCPGSGHRPFNTHTDRIEQAIKDAEASAVQLRTRAQEVRKPATDTTAVAWVETAQYIGRDRITSWQEVPVHEETYGDGRYKKFLVDEQDFRGNMHRREVHFSHPVPKTRAEAIDQMNEKRARAFEQDAAQRAAYITWQRARLKTWEPKPLVPRSAPAADTRSRNEHGELTKTEIRNGQRITLARRHHYGRSYRWVITKREPVENA